MNMPAVHVQHVPGDIARSIGSQKRHRLPRSRHRFPGRPSGIVAINRGPQLLIQRRVIGVSIYPGATAFTVMPREPLRGPSTRVSPISPAFDAA